AFGKAADMVGPGSECFGLGQSPGLAVVGKHEGQIGRQFAGADPIHDGLEIGAPARGENAYAVTAHRQALTAASVLTEPWAWATRISASRAASWAEWLWDDAARGLPAGAA